MRSLFLFGVYCAFLALGLWAPFIIALGYIWTDLFTPQALSWSLLNSLPVSLIMGAAAFTAYLMTDRAHPPRLTFGIQLLLLWALWITLTTTWAVVPDAAWAKWNVAVKVVLFAAFMPYLFRSRIQIEACILVIVLSLSGTIAAFGAKTLISGGGYGRQLGLAGGNSGLAEGSTLAAVAVSLIPFIFFLKRHTQLLPSFKGANLAYYSGAALAVLTAIGTFTRTALVTLGVYWFLAWWRAKRKVLMAVVLLVSAAVFSLATTDQWTQRVSTISDPNDDASALGRIAVWLWTLDYVAEHPQGGGFDAYLIDRFTVPMGNTGEELEVQAKAFHSIYFEVLGEHGVIGFALFATMILAFYLRLWGLARKCRRFEQMAWLKDFSGALMVSMTVYLCGGAFIGVAFQPFLYYLLALSVSAEQFYARCARQGAQVRLREALTTG